MNRLVLFLLCCFLWSCGSNEMKLTEDPIIVYPIDSFFVKPTDDNQIYSYYLLNEDTLIGSSYTKQTIEVFTKDRSVDTFYLAKSIEMPVYDKSSFFTYFEFNNKDLGVVYEDDIQKIFRLNRDFDIVDSFDVNFKFSYQTDIHEDKFWLQNYVTTETGQINDSILVVSIHHSFSGLQSNPNNTNVLFYNMNTRKASYENFYTFSQEILNRNYKGGIFPNMNFSHKEVLVYNTNLDSIYAYNYLTQQNRAFAFNNPFYQLYNDDFYIKIEGDTTNIDKKLWRENYFNKYLMTKGDEYTMLFYPAYKEHESLIHGMRFDSLGNSLQFYKLNDNDYPGVKTFFADDEYFYLYKHKKSLEQLAPIQIFKFRKDDFFQ